MFVEPIPAFAGMTKEQMIEFLRVHDSSPSLNKRELGLKKTKRHPAGREVL
jgi:hypothetical protein